jgi:dihydrolipoamide dehydrogenase
MDEAEHMADCGVTFAAPQIDLDKLRAHKAKVVGKLTTGLAGMAKLRKVDIVRGYGSFLDANHIEVELTDGAGQDKTGSKKVIRFKNCIIAAGSAPVHLPFIPQDPRIVDSTGALELRFVPKKMLVIGGGIIGLEMATVYSLLGARVDVVEMLDGLMQGPGPRRGQGLGKAEPQPLRQGHAEDQDRLGRRQGRRPLRQASKAKARRPKPSSTT